MDFDPEDIFDTEKKYMKLIKRNYQKHGNDANCFVSFYSKELTATPDLVVNSISDCVNKFKGQIKVGKLSGEVPKTLKKNKCYYQKDWIFCVCDVTFCNSPQFWPLMLARFSHDNAPATRKESGAWQDAEGVIKRENLHKSLKIEKDSKNAYRDNLRCLVWLSDAVYQEEANPPFYFYNYISTVHRAPPLADALAIAPVLRKKGDWGTVDNFTMTRLHLKEKEPFEDGSHESDHDYRTYPHEVMEDKKNAELATYLAAAGAVWFSITMIGTVLFLAKICRRVQDHSQFSRTNDIRAQRRYERCFKLPQLPKEFTKVRNGEITKKNDMEAGPSVK